jgi:hypothetical protein
MTALRAITMTKDTTNLRSLVEKSADADLLREMIGFAAERLMTLEVGAKTGGGTASRMPSGLPSATAIATGLGTGGHRRAAHSQASYRQPFPELSRTKRYRLSFLDPGPCCRSNW